MATTEITLNGASYTEVVDGSGFIDLPTGMSVRWVAAASEPAATTDIFHSLTGDLNYGGSDKIYMMIRKNTSGKDTVIATAV